MNEIISNWTMKTLKTIGGYVKNKLPSLMALALAIVAYNALPEMNEIISNPLVGVAIAVFTLVVICWVAYLILSNCDWMP